MTSVRIFAIAGTTDPAEDYRLIDSGLLVPASALNARSGVTCTPTLTSTGAMTCNVSAFTAVIDGTSNSMQGVYRIAVDGPSGITISAGSAQARVDLIYAQILDNAYDASGQTKGQVQYLAGTSGSGSPPATPANAIPLFNIPVPAGAASIDFSTAVAVYSYTAAAGGIVPVRNAADKPAAAAGAQYRHRMDVTAAAGAVSPLESSTDGTTWTPVFDPSGIQWQAYTPTWTATVTNPTLGNGSISMRYLKLGRLVFVHFKLIAGSTTTYGNGQWVFSLPVATAAGVVTYLGGAACDIGSSNWFYGGIWSNVTIFTPFFGTGGAFVSATTPATWTSAGGILEANFVYESAT